MPQPMRKGWRVSDKRGGVGDGPPLWEDAVDAYLRDCRRRNMSMGTIEQYEWALLGSRAKIWRQDYNITTVADLTAHTMRAFEEDLADAKLKPSTIAGQHRRLHSFGLWCQKTYGVGGEVRDVDAPIVPQEEPECYSHAQIAQILLACQSPRDQLIVEVLLATGLRASEFCKLTVDDFEQAPDGTAWFRVRQGKGRKDRIVPMDTPQKPLSRRVKRHISTGRAEIQTDSLFGLTYSGLKSIMWRLSLQTGINVHAHAFRHTFASRAIQAGVNPVILQRVLGHTTMRLLNLYVHAHATEITDAWAKRRD